MPGYADVILDANVEALDRIFEYRIPENLTESVSVGSKVLVPFGKGNSLREGFVTAVKENVSYPEEKIKEIASVPASSVSIEGELIGLAAWMRDRYGSTMSQALRTVLPVKARIRSTASKSISLAISKKEAEEALKTAEKKNHTAKARLLSALLQDEKIPLSLARKSLSLSSSTIRSLTDDGIICVSEEEPAEKTAAIPDRAEKPVLTSTQQTICSEILSGYRHRDTRPCLIHGITGSGKTEIYMTVMEDFIRSGKQVIVLIPEISLTYQTEMRFFRRFGSRVGVIHSKLSAGEKYEQFLRAKNGDIDIMIGPRSALFTPFANLGLIIIDEEHDHAYQSEFSPRYHAKEVAIRRAEQNNGLVILGSATPSVTSYRAAEEGKYRLFTLKERAVNGSTLPEVSVVDLREELKSGNKSIFSRLLYQKIRHCLDENEQAMLFLNRRGYSGSVTCRNCGSTFVCPHCDVALTLHRNGELVCHYCGYRTMMPRNCPACGSPYLASFGLGTEKAEEMVREAFPDAKILRMDMDTTTSKNSYEEILSAFSEKKADILIGTQMIVKGHDFPDVTVVGILAADLSLYRPDYRSSEETFDLLTQAAGRAGRAKKPGSVVIQTYNPDHYAIKAAAAQDYDLFYSREMAYRNLMHYPPCSSMMEITVTSPNEENLNDTVSLLADVIRCDAAILNRTADLIGPGTPAVSRIKDMYRREIIVKADEKNSLFRIRGKISQVPVSKDIYIQSDIS